MEQIQKNILSIAILYPKERYLIFRDLEEHHFMNEYRTIFQEMQQLYNSNKEIDPLVILNDLGQEYALKIAELSDISYVKPNTKQYIDILINDYQRKQAKDKLTSILFNLERKEYKPEQLQDDILEASKIFQSNNSRFKSYTMMEGLTNVLNNLEKKKQYHKTGFSYLDKIIYIDKADFVIIGGRPSSGKTTFATNIMTNMSENNKVLFFSLETAAEGIYQKIISSKANINIAKILNNNLTDEDYTKYLSVSNELDKHNLEVIEASGMAINDITSTTLQKKADIIFIDYMQLIQEQGRTEYERVSEISKKLHIFAQKEKVCVIALSQLSRMENENRKPTMSDLRSSGQIEQDADSIILIYKPNTDTGQDQDEKQPREVIVAKNKKGYTGTLNFNFYGGTQTFYEA